MPDIVKCQECGIIVGQYVTLDEYKELLVKTVLVQDDLSNALSDGLNPYRQEEGKTLRRLLERVVKLGSSLSPGPSLWNDNQEEFRQLLADIREVLK